MSANGGGRNSRSPSLYKSNKGVEATVRIKYFKLWNQIKSLQWQTECLMKKKQLNFGKRALLHFNLEIPIPSSVTALQDDSTFLT